MNFGNRNLKIKWIACSTILVLDVQYRIYDNLHGSITIEDEGPVPDVTCYRPSFILLLLHFLYYT